MMARAGYAMVFCVLLPAALVLWAWQLDRVAGLPSMEPLWWGWMLAALGMVLMAWAMVALKLRGGGLPMNAFPPPRLVTAGVYAVVGHPIYVGFVLLVAGVAAGVGSAGGLLVVAPCVALGCAALAWGYEEHDLNQRFGSNRARPWLRLPECAHEQPATPADVLRVWFLVYAPWVVAYEAVGHLPFNGAIELMVGSQSTWPVWTWTVVFYSAAYPFALVAPWLVRQRGALATWARDALLGVVLGFLIMLTLPAIASVRPFDVDGWCGWLLHLERSDGVGSRAAMPSFHVYWAWMAAALVATRGRTAAMVAAALAAAISVSCVTTGMHAMVDVLAGAVLAAVALRRAWLWRAALRAAQWVTDHWVAWDLGPMRVLVHSWYAALAAGLGVVLVAVFAPDVEPWKIATMATASLVGAGLWGQALVGSRRLQRPFGYFGSVAGVVVAGGLLAACGMEVWPVLAGVCAAAPWIQGIGRLRCMVQGCCHGAPTASGGSGLVHTHPQSRVVAISGLRGVCIHATPLYSLLANFVLGALMARLCFLGAPASMVGGLYLVLQGVCRFVEESYRGEVQTQRAAGLRIYQWFAAAICVTGCVVTAVPSPAVVHPALPADSAWMLAAVVAVLHGVAMGVEFPRCNWPLSRLTPQQ